MAVLGHSPLEAYAELFRGAFVGKFNLGGTLERFVPLLLTALAFAVSSKVAVFNVGVEGELYLGAIAAAWAGVWTRPSATSRLVAGRRWASSVSRSRSGPSVLARASV